MYGGNGCTTLNNINDHVTDLRLGIKHGRSFLRRLCLRDSLNTSSTQLGSLIIQGPQYNTLILPCLYGAPFSTKPATMICRSCRTTMLSRFTQPVSRTASASAHQLPLARSQFRTYSSDNNASVAAPPSPPSPRQPTVGDLSTPSAISSATPGVSQPLSTPEGVHVDINPAESTKPTALREPSSCPAGTKMNGLNYFKNKPDVFAKEDSEYPEWLWGLLGDSSKDAKTKTGGVDPSSMFYLGFLISGNSMLTPSQP